MSAASPEPAAPAAPPELIRKAGAVARRVYELREEISALQARAALTRSQLTQAVLASQQRRAEAQAALRRLVQPVYFAKAARPGPAALRRATWRARKLLVRLGLPGQALLIAGSGHWRSSGRRLYDLRHLAAYLRRRADPSVAPAALFDQPDYLARHPDVAARRLAPLLHYVASGRAEGRSPHPLFDAEWYAQRNADALAASGLWPLAHFTQVGARTGRDPHPFFDMAYYAGHAPELAPGEDLPSHYLREGWRLGLSPHPLFDPAWYRTQMPASAAAIPPLVHFAREGTRGGLSPHPLFDPAWYLAQAPHAARSGLDPLRHYLAAGAAQGLSPSPWFDPPHYAARRGAALPAGADPLVDYLLGGAWSVAEPAPGFATAAYLAAHPELVEAGLTPLAHAAAADRLVD